jgi:hypothetical protein
VQAAFLFETLPAYIHLSIVWLCATGDWYQGSASVHIPWLRRYWSRAALALALLFVVGAAFYYGTYLPTRKAIAVNRGLAAVSLISSVDQFRELFSSALEQPAPYGQDEALKIIGSVVIDILQKQPSPDVARALADTLDRWYQPVVNRGKGNGFAQNIFILGRVHELAGNNDQASTYYRLGTERWPRRPDFRDRLKLLLHKSN